jgi:Sugar (and other) transporter
VFAVYILVLTVWSPDTPRWLMRRDGGSGRGLIVLAKLRDLEPSHARIQREKYDIMEVIAIESKEEGTWGDLFRGSGIVANKSFYLALGIQFMKQMTDEHRVHLHFNTATDDLQVSEL